jgi:hypothetical protein
MTPTITLKLHPDGVAAPALRAAANCREIVDFYFNALENTDLSKAPEATHDARPFFRFNMNLSGLSSEQRRQLHESWILSKAFQDLMRGLRASLEEAFFFIQLMDTGTFRAASEGTLEQVLRPFRRRALAMNFPQLLEAVNARLDKPLRFAEAYQSLQDARNCLEHGNGIVAPKNAKTGGKMILQFPFMKVFVERNGEQVEVSGGFVSGGEMLMITTSLRTREYEVGQRLNISAADFEEIAFACWHFAVELARNLPKSPAGLELPE